MATGSALNYTLVHVLHLTDPNTHFIATSLVVAFRGFAGSFGTSIGGGIFQRVLNQHLTTGFARNGLDKNGTLTRKLLGSPRTVLMLTGEARDIATQGYSDAIRALFLTAAGIALVATAVQAGTGWAEFKTDHPAEEDPADPSRRSAT